MKAATTPRTCKLPEVPDEYRGSADLAEWWRSGYRTCLAGRTRSAWHFGGPDHADAWHAGWLDAYTDIREGMRCRPLSITRYERDLMGALHRRFEKSRMNTAWLLSIRPPPTARSPRGP